VRREEEGGRHAGDAAADDEYVCHVPPTRSGCETRDDAAPEGADAHPCRQRLTATAATRPRSRQRRHHGRRQADSRRATASSTRVTANSTAWSRSRRAAPSAPQLKPPGKDRRTKWARRAAGE